MPISDEAFEACAKKIQKEAKTGTPEVWILKNIIYDFLTRRVPEEKEEKLRKKYEKYNQDYNNVIKTLKFDASARTSSNGAWFFITTQVNLLAPKARYGKWVAHQKEYFTFHTDKKKLQDAFGDILKFLQALPDLHRKFYALSYHNADNISFKVCSDLSLFVVHTEPLVVHYRRKDMEAMVRKTVEDTMQEHGVLLRKRKYRAEHGFDFNDAEDENLGGHSHSELVAKILAKYIIKEKQTIAHTSIAQIVDWLRKSLLIVNKWDEDQMARELNENI